MFEKLLNDFGMLSPRQGRRNCRCHHQHHHHHHRRVHETGQRRGGGEEGKRSGGEEGKLFDLTSFGSHAFNAASEGTIDPQ